MVEQPSRGLGYSEDDEDDPKGKDGLESQWPAPGEWSSDETEGKVPPVSECDTDADEHDLCGDETTSFGAFTKFGLVPTKISNCNINNR